MNKTGSFLSVLKTTITKAGVKALALREYAFPATNPKTLRRRRRAVKAKLAKLSRPKKSPVASN